MSSCICICYLRQGGYVMPGRLSVCLCVCLLATLRKKTTERIFVKILPQMCLCTRKIWLNFGSHPPLDPDPGIFWRILQHCQAFFPQVGSYLWTNWWDLHENFTTNVLWTTKSPLNFGSHPDPDLESRYVLWIRRSALSEYSGLYAVFQKSDAKIQITITAAYLIRI